MGRSKSQPAHEPYRKAIPFNNTIVKTLLFAEHISVRSSGVKDADTGLCRSLKFSTPLNGYALEGHVIKNISLKRCNE